jgi:undecaprenyl-phosphate 4-deoxy-4-formamido-L-arabinose transferase
MERPIIKERSTYSVVVPVYNAEDTLEELVLRLIRTFEKIKEPYELIFIDDNSQDRSWDILRSLREKHPEVSCYQLMRNYGQQNATMCGFRLAKGQFILTLDDDLQNPPEEIPSLITELEKGYDAVFGVYEAKKHTRYRLWGSWLINKFYVLTFKTKGRVSAFRILRSDLAKKILEYDLNFTYINGLISWYSDRISRVNVKHQLRPQGRSGYTLGKLLALSVNMMTNFSLLPLQIASFAGLLFASAGFILGLFFGVRRLLFGTDVSGFTAIFVSISFFSGMILFFLGVIGEYIGRIHLNINRRPQYSIRQEDEDTSENTSPKS